MSIFLGGCGCCGPGGGDDEPPTIDPPPGDDPDDGWLAGYYVAIKYARVVRDGFPDLRTYYRTIPYDTGIRFEECEELQNEPSVPSTARKYWKFFPGAETIDLDYAVIDGESRNYGLGGATPVSSLGQFTPGSPTVSIGAGITPFISTENGIIYEQTQEPSFLFRDFNWATVAQAEAIGNLGLDGSTVVTTATGEIPESLLDDIEDKLNASPFIKDVTVIGLQLNPKDVAGDPHVEGPRSGVRYHCETVPAYPFFFPVKTLGGAVVAFSIDYWSKGSIANEAAAFTGLRLKRDKVRLQLGSKSPAGTINKTYRVFTIPDGFNVITAGEVARTPPAGITVLDSMTRLPANAVFTDEQTIVLTEGTVATIDPNAQEVYFFDANPVSSALVSVAEVLTPLPAKMRLWRKFAATFTRFEPITQITPLRIGLRWQSEDRCLKHELYRKVNAGAESLLATVTTAPEEWPVYFQTGLAGWSGFINPDTGFVQFPLGYEWQYLDEDVAEGNTYTYRIKSYYDTSYKSDYSAAYAVTI